MLEDSSLKEVIRDRVKGTALPWACTFGCKAGESGTDQWDPGQVLGALSKDGGHNWCCFWRQHLGLETPAG